MPSRPYAVAFDVIETMMALQPLSARFAAVGLPEHLLATWFARTVRDGFVFAAAGGFAPFPDVAAQALRIVSGFQVDDAQVADVLAGMRDLPAHPDVEPAVRLLAEAGVRLACLTNGSPSVTADFVERSGLAPYFDTVISIEDTQTWKPAAGVYRHAASALAVEPSRLALIAAHAWDCHGAHRAGLTTGWVSRLEREHSPVYDEPDVTGADLVEVARGLLALRPDT